MNHPPCSHRRLFFFIPLFVSAFIALLGLIVQLIWNHVLVDVTSVHPIVYWQALCLLILGKILFGGFAFRGPAHIVHRARERHFERHLESLDPAERERFREEMRRRFGDWPRPSWCHRPPPPPPPAPPAPPPPSRP